MNNLFTEEEMIKILERSGKCKVMTFYLSKAHKSFNDSVTWETYPCKLAIPSETKNIDKFRDEIKNKPDHSIRTKYGIDKVFNILLKKALLKIL